MEGREFVSNKIGYLAEKISKQSIEGASWPLLTTYRQLLEDRGELEKELLSQGNSKFKVWKMIRVSIFQKEETPESTAGMSLDIIWNSMSRNTEQPRALGVKPLQWALKGVLPPSVFLEGRASDQR
jgi:hypothetical protein